RLRGELVGGLRPLGLRVGQPVPERGRRQAARRDLDAPALRQLRRGDREPRAHRLLRRPRSRVRRACALRLRLEARGRLMREWVAVAAIALGFGILASFASKEPSWFSLANFGLAAARGA